MSANPIDGFTIERHAITYLGQGLQRPECILAEVDGSLWSADARGGVVHIRPDRTQTLVTQLVAAGFASRSPMRTASRLERCPTGWRLRATATLSCRISAPIGWN